MTAQDCAIESMRHSLLATEPSGDPSSKNARRYQSPSQASRSSDCFSAAACWRQPPRAAPRRAARPDPQTRQRRIEEPAEPHAFALAALADPVHAVVPVAGAHQRQAVHAGGQSSCRAPARNDRTGWPCRRSSAGRKRRVSPSLQHGPLQERHHLIEHRDVAGRPRHSGPRHRRASRDHRRPACGCRGRIPAATNAEHRLRENCRAAARSRCSRARSGRDTHSAITSCNWSRKP